LTDASSLGLTEFLERILQLTILWNAMMDEEWEYSPRSTIPVGDLSLLPPLDEPCGVSLENFIQQLPIVVKERQFRGIPAGSVEDPIQNLFE
jgi:hypothetical protein